MKNDCHTQHLSINVYKNAMVLCDYYENFLHFQEGDILDIRYMFDYNVVLNPDPQSSIACSINIMYDSIFFRP